MKGREGGGEECMDGKSEYESHEDFRGFVGVDDCDGLRVGREENGMRNRVKGLLMAHDAR